MSYTAIVSRKNKQVKMPKSSAPTFMCNLYEKTSREIKLINISTTSQKYVDLPMSVNQFVKPFRPCYL